MRVVYLSACSEVGGAERALLCLLKGLRKLNPDWQFHLISTKAGPLLEEADGIGVETSVLPLPRTLMELGDAALKRPGSSICRCLTLCLKLLYSVPVVCCYLLRLRSQINKFCPDVLHSNGFKMHLLGGLARPSRVPLIWHIHDYVSTRPAMKHLLRIIRKRNSAVIANSHSVAADVSHSGINHRHIYPIWNAVDLNHFLPVGPKLDLDFLAGVPAADDETLRIGLIATFAKWKGHQVFLKSLSLLPRKLRLRAYIIGDGIYDTTGSQITRGELQTLAEACGVADRVVFTGRVSDIPAAMRALDVVVHASTTPEPFGLVIAEAMACARPLIVSNAGGAAEIVASTPGVFLHEPGSAHQLAECIVHAFEQSKQVKSIPGLRSYALSQFSSKRFACEVSLVYCAVCRSHHGSSVTFTAEPSSAA